MLGIRKWYPPIYKGKSKDQRASKYLPRPFSLHFAAISATADPSRDSMDAQDEPTGRGPSVPTLRELELETLVRERDAQVARLSVRPTSLTFSPHKYAY